MVKTSSSSQSSSSMSLGFSALPPRGLVCFLWTSTSCIYFFHKVKLDPSNLRISIWSFPRNELFLHGLLWPIEVLLDASNISDSMGVNNSIKQLSITISQQNNRSKQLTNLLPKNSQNDTNECILHAPLCIHLPNLPSSLLWSPMLWYHYYRSVEQRATILPRVWIQRQKNGEEKTLIVWIGNGSV